MPVAYAHIESYGQHMGYIGYIELGGQRTTAFSSRAAG